MDALYSGPEQYRLDRVSESFQTLRRWTNLSDIDALIVSRWLVRGDPRLSVLQVATVQIAPLSARGRRTLRYLQDMGAVEAWFWICSLPLYREKVYLP